MPELNPFVYWAQTETDICLRVDLKDLKDTEISIEEDEIEVSTLGVGAQGCEDGRQRYHFVIEFFLPINTDLSNYQIRNDSDGGGIQVSLKKMKPDWWPRLMYQQQKLSWLKIDFDRWRSDDSDNEGKREIKKNVRFAENDNPFAGMSSEEMLKNQYPDAFRDLQKQEYGFVTESTRKTYLFCYNLFMFCGFLFIFAISNIRYAATGDEFVSKAWKSVGPTIKLLHLFMFLEVLHPIFGYTKGTFLKNLAFVGFRNFVIFVLIESEPRMHEKPVVFYLMMVYGALDIIRYPYHLLKVYDIEVGLLTWLHYTIWVPLCPLAFVFEGVITLRDIPFFEESERFSVSLPNQANFAFYFPNLLRFYLLFCFFPIMYNMMQQMYRSRCKKLNIKQHSANKRSWWEKITNKED